jgi:thiol-disulfide isomerase/thioredoxin
MKDLENVEQLEELIENNKVVVLNVYSDNCGFCRKFSPEYEELAKKYKNHQFAKVKSSKKLVNNVRGVPTTLVIVDEDVKEVVVGAKKDELEKHINNLY